jgi:hypothetical protein
MRKTENQTSLALNLVAYLFKQTLTISSFYGCLTFIYSLVNPR